MTIEEFIQFVQNHEHFKSATNLKTHLHIIEWDGKRILSYFNQPILVEIPITDLKHAEKYTIADIHGGVCCVPFPCMEVFCPSFNAKTSMLVDLYKTAVLMCKKEFHGGLPDEFIDYSPKSIKCEPSRSTRS